jgi:hypothetical protein
VNNFAEVGYSHTTGINFVQMMMASVTVGRNRIVNINKSPGEIIGNCQPVFESLKTTAISQRRNTVMIERIEVRRRALWVVIALKRKDFVRYFSVNCRT